MLRNDGRTQEQQCSPANLLDKAKCINLANTLFNSERFSHYIKSCREKFKYARGRETKTKVSSIKVKDALILIC